jgi:hypothetical protein
MHRILIVLSVVVAVAHVAAAEELGQPISLFDGESFQGWEGNLDAFRIEDGAIVGGSLTKPIPRNDYLCSKKTYTDFELRLKFKVLGEDVSNRWVAQKGT